MKSFSDVAVTPLGAEAVVAVKLAVLLPLIPAEVLKNCFLKYVVSSVVNAPIFELANANSVINAV